MRVGVESESEIDEIICPDADLKQFQRNRNNYKKYLVKCGIDLNKSYLLCEFDGRGTSQHFIDKLFDRRLKGLYFFTIFTKEPYHIERCYVHSMMSHKKEYSSIYQSVPFLEFFFSAPERSVCGINDDLTFEYKKEMRSQEDITFMLDVQESLLERTIDFIKKIAEYECTISPELVEHLFNKFTVVEFADSTELLNNIVLSDELTGKVFDMNFKSVQ
jgi:hypothetical protein